MKHLSTVNCLTKMAYKTQDDAINAAKHVMERDNSGQSFYKKLRPYKCNICTQWHLTKSKKKKSTNA